MSKVMWATEDGTWGVCDETEITVIKLNALSPQQAGLIAEASMYVGDKAAVAIFRDIASRIQKDETND